MPAYVPPARRGVAGQQAEPQPDRIWKCKVEFTTSGPFSPDDCPETLLDTDEPDQAPEVTVRQFELPSEVSTSELKQLLAWFAKASAVTSEQCPQGDARARLLFPPSLSKDSRKLVHQLAEGLQLPTFSKGLGEERRLAVHGAAFRGTPEMEVELAAAAARRRAPAAVRDRAKQIWRWCQAEGGSLWNLSQGELEEALLAAPDESALPPAVKDMLERRQHGAALIAAIKAGDAAAALAILEAHPRSAWIREEAAAAGSAGSAGAGQQQQHREGSPSGARAGGGGGGAAAGGAAAAEDHGYYPLHLAAVAGMGEVVERIAAQPGAVEQRDRLYATPLKAAKKAGQTGMVEILLRHGAKDYEINQAAHKTAAIGIPAPPGPGGRRPSGSTAAGSYVGSYGGSFGGSPRVGSPALGTSAGTGGGGASAASPHVAGSYMAAHAAARQRRTSGDVSHGPTGHHRPSPGPASHAHAHGGQQQQQHHGQGHGHGHGHGQQHPPAHGAGAQHGHGLQHHAHAAGGAHPPAQPHGTPGQDPRLNPFAVLAGAGASPGGDSSSGGEGGPRRPSGGSGAAKAAAGVDAGDSDSDGSAGGGGAAAAAVSGPGRLAGYGTRGGRVRGGGMRCALPPIQSGEVSETSVAAALAAMGLSAKPALETAAEVSEAAEAGAVGGSDGEDNDGAASAGGGSNDGAQKKRKTRRGRRGRGSRRHSVATTDEAAAAVVAAAAAAEAGIVVAAAPAVTGLRDGGRAGNLIGSAPTGASGAQLMNAYMARRRSGGGGGKARSKAGSSVGGDSSSGSDSDSDGSAGGGKTRRGGQPARARRHERRRAQRAEGGGGGERHRRGSGTEYASFHQGHGGGKAGHGHYAVVGGAHHGHADDVTSWRRDPTAAAAPAGVMPPSPMRVDEPRAPAPAAGRPPAPRRMSAGPGAPPLPPLAGGGGVHGTASGGGAAQEAPASPFHHGLPHAPRATAEREHVAVGPTAGQGFGFGRGRGRGVVAGGAAGIAGSIAPGSAPAVAPGAIASAAGAPPPAQ